MVLAVLYRIELEKAQDLSEEGEENKEGRGKSMPGIFKKLQAESSSCDQQVRG